MQAERWSNESRNKQVTLLLSAYCPCNTCDPLKGGGAGDKNFPCTRCSCSWRRDFIILVIYKNEMVRCFEVSLNFYLSFWVTLPDLHFYSSLWPAGSIVVRVRCIFGVVSSPLSSSYHSLSNFYCRSIFALSYHSLFYFYIAYCTLTASTICLCPAFYRELRE